MKPVVLLNGRKARVGIFLSGGGSNAREILKQHKLLGGDSPIIPVALVTDRPDDPSCGAFKIGEEFGIQVVGEDIQAFYRSNNCDRVSLRTEEGRRLRELWTELLRDKLSGLEIDFGVFAGFEPLSNITEDFCCLNVHPGDLRYLKDGKRYLVGLHTVPIERAILEGLKELRTSVIVATSYHDEGSDMDSGPILGISPSVSVDLEGCTVKELEEIAARRPEKRPGGGYGDQLERIAKANQNRLKEGGDWIVFPKVVFAVAREEIGIE